MVDEAALTIVVRMETAPALALALEAIPTRTGTRCHRTDNQRDSHTRHHSKALAGKGGMGGRHRHRRIMVGLGAGLRGPHEVGRTAGVLEADMGSLAILSRTDGEGIVVVAAAAATVVAMVVVVVVAMVVPEVLGVLKGVMVSTVPRMGTVAVPTAVVAHSMEHQEVGGAAVGSAVIYSLYILPNARKL